MFPSQWKSLAQYGQCSLDDVSDGFCTQGKGTTGGKGGKVVRIKEYKALVDALDSQDAFY